MARLTDNDRTYGPLTIGKSDWNAFRVMYSSGGGDDEESYNNLVIHLGKLFICRLKLPTIVRRYKEKVMAPSWDAATVARLGRDYYYNVYPREYGFVSCKGSTTVHYGVNDDRGYLKVCSKSKFFTHPWAEHELTLHTLYDSEDKLYWKMGKYDKYNTSTDVAIAMTKTQYLIEDFDGTHVKVLVSRCMMGWEKGEGLFKFLRWFTKPEVKNYLDITFEKPVGRAKDSWKGGLISTSIDINKGESRHAVFLRYCSMVYESREGPYEIKYLERLENTVHFS